MAKSSSNSKPAGKRNRKTPARTSKSINVPSQAEDESNISQDNNSLTSDNDFIDESLDENDDDQDLYNEIREEEERVRILGETNDLLSQKLADKQKLQELREKRKSLELEVLDAKRKLLLNTNNFNSRDQEDHLLPQNNLLVQGSKGSVGDVPPAKSGTMFINDDGIVFFAMDKKSAGEKIKKCFALGRALDLERKKLLLGDEGFEYDPKAIKDKLIGFSSRTKADLMSTGSDISKYAIAPTWLSTKKLTDEAIFCLPVINVLEKFDKLLTFTFEFRDYNVLSLDDFVKGGFLDDSDHALLRATLMRTQEVMAGVFGKSFNKVFESYIGAIQEEHHGYDGEFLRFLAEEALYLYGQYMSEPWNEGLKLVYQLDDIHSPGNAALLLSSMFERITPLKSNEQEYHRKLSKYVKRNSKSGKNLGAITQSITNLIGSSKLNKAANNKLGKVNKVARTATTVIPPARVVTKQPSNEVFCFRQLKNALKLSTTACHFGLKCRNSHREPTKLNKTEIQKIVGGINHPGNNLDKSNIHDALALL